MNIFKSTVPARSFEWDRVWVGCIGILVYYTRCVEIYPFDPSFELQRSLYGQSYSWISFSTIHIGRVVSDRRKWCTFRTPHSIEKRTSRIYNICNSLPSDWWCILWRNLPSANLPPLQQPIFCSTINHFQTHTQTQTAHIASRADTFGIRASQIWGWQRNVQFFAGILQNKQTSTTNSNSKC